MVGQVMTSRQKAQFEQHYGASFLHSTRSMGPLRKRLQVWSAAKDVYVPGDSREVLKAKLIKRLNVVEGTKAGMDWLALIEKLLPIIMQLLAMFLGQ